jgi:signal transduction histidine kinase
MKSSTGYYFKSDGEMLGHVFSNIINNGVKYRLKGKEGLIQIRGRKNKKVLQIVFADKGIGLVKSEIKKAFDRFYQSSPSSEGSGVGLSICKRIVEDLYLA